MADDPCTQTGNIATFLNRFDISHNVLLENTKTIIIQTLRESFANDPVHPYKADEAGFPILPKFRFIDSEEEMGVDGVEWGNDPSETITSIIITDIYRYDAKFLPAITVRLGGGANKDISFNQEWGSLKWAERETLRNGEVKFEKYPSHFIFAGSWTQNYNITIMSEDTLTRELLADKLSIMLMHLKRRELEKKGVFVQNVSVGSETEEEADDSNEKYYNVTLNLEVYTEWYREIPIYELVEKVDFQLNAFSSVLSEFEIKLLKAFYNNSGRLSEFYSSVTSEPAYDNSSTSKIAHGRTVTVGDLVDELL